MASYGVCVGGTTRFLLHNIPDDSIAVTVFEDNTCSGNPVKITFEQGFGCIQQDAAIGVCKPSGSSHYSIASCASNFSGYASTMFDSVTPYLLAEEARNMWCEDMESATAYIADGICHSNTDDTTSFLVTFTAQNTVEMTTYLDARCESVDNSTEVSERALLSYSCIQNQRCSNVEDGNWCAYKYSVGGLGGSTDLSSRAVVAMYDGISCSGTPVQLLAESVRSCSSSDIFTCTMTSVGTSTMSIRRDCTSDISSTATLEFGTIPHLVVEQYTGGTNCMNRETTVVYRADNECHPSISDGTYFKIMPNVGSLLTLATYPTAFCNDFDADYTTVGTKYLNTGVLQWAFETVRRYGISAVASEATNGYRLQDPRGDYVP